MIRPSVRCWNMDWCDTLFSMIVGWAINGAMILLAAAAFFKSGDRWKVAADQKSLERCWERMMVFALWHYWWRVSSTIIAVWQFYLFAGIFGESYHIKDGHSQVGVILSLGIFLLIFFIWLRSKDCWISQMILSIQLPFAVFHLEVGLTSSFKSDGQWYVTANGVHLYFMPCCGGCCAGISCCWYPSWHHLNNSVLRNQIVVWKGNHI